MQRLVLSQIFEVLVASMDMRPMVRNLKYSSCKHALNEPLRDVMGPIKSCLMAMPEAYRRACIETLKARANKSKESHLTLHTR